MPRRNRRHLARNSTLPSRLERHAATGHAPPKPPGPFQRPAVKDELPQRPVHTVQVSAAFL
ncbi:hypothetical protein [Streptomyces sp. NPDC046821]|uniref:hypothetical protein n=1 Tax=Streptomyces sp. NPDC046821 TaxID=3154702 RepID=UPI0033CDEDBF